MIVYLVEIAIDEIRACGVEQIPLRGMLDRLQSAVDSEFPLAPMSSLEVRSVRRASDGERATVLDPPRGRF